MSTVIEETRTRTEGATPRPMPQNDVLVLRGVTWKEYRRFRDDPSNDGLRMHYSNGALLLMTTGRLHERVTRLLERLLCTWAVDNDVAVMSFGHWTLQKELEEKGLESDNCYYISNVSAVRGKRELDLETDPPPDLAMEVDITTYSRHKFDIYAALRIPELWVWQGGSIQVYRLSSGTYDPVEASMEVSEFPLATAADVIAEHLWEDDGTVIVEFQKRID